MSIRLNNPGMSLEAQGYFSTVHHIAAETKILERIEELFGRGTLFSIERDRIIDLEFYSKTKMKEMFDERYNNRSFEDMLGAGSYFGGMVSTYTTPKRKRVYLQGYLDNSEQLGKPPECDSGSVLMFIDMVSPNPYEKYNLNSTESHLWAKPFYSDEEEERAVEIKKWNYEEQWREIYQKEQYYLRADIRRTQHPKGRWLIASSQSSGDTTNHDHSKSMIMETHLDAANLSVLIPKNRNFSTLKFRTCAEFINLMANDEHFAERMLECEKKGDAQAYCTLFFTAFKRKIRNDVRGF